MKNYFFLLMLLSNYKGYTQNNYILDSIVLPAKKNIEDKDNLYLSKYNASAKVGYALMEFFNSQSSHYYYVLNNEIVNKPTLFDTLQYKVQKNIFKIGLQNSLVKIPDLSINTNIYLDSITNFYCKEMFKTKVDIFNKKKFESFAINAQKLFLSNKNLQEVYQKALSSFEQKDSAPAAAIEIKFLLDCSYYQDRYFDITEFSHPNIFEEFYHSSKHIGNYFDKMMMFYKNNNFNSLSKKLPNYKIFLPILKDIASVNNLEANYQKRIFVKLPSNKWQFTIYLTNEVLEAKNNFYGKLIFTFDTLTGKPLINNLQLIKAKTTDKFRTDNEFKQWKKDFADFSDIPPPPPPPPPPLGNPSLSKKEAEEIMLLRKKRLEEW